MRPVYLVASSVTVLVLLVCTVACTEGGSGAAKGQDTPPSQQPRTVQVAQVTQQSLARSVVVTGTLAADERVTISAKVPGRLASIAVDLGSVVQAGQVIAQVEPIDYRLRVEQAASAVAQSRALLGLSSDGDDAPQAVDDTSLVREARATAEDAQARHARAQTLAEQKLISAAELDAARTEMLRAQSALENAREQMRSREATLRQRKAELASARQQLTDSQLRTSIDGVVETRHVSAGEFLAAGASIATVVRISPLRLRVEVSEHDAAVIRVGQDVRVTLTGDTETYLGKIARMSPSISEQTRTLAVEAEIPNPGHLRPGSFARAEIVMADPEPALVVPSSAVVTFAGIEKVLGVVEGKAVETTITTGRRNAEVIEVVRGLKLGDTVIVAPGNLQQGQPVVTANVGGAR